MKLTDFHRQATIPEVGWKFSILTYLTLNWATFCLLEVLFPLLIARFKIAPPPHLSPKNSILYLLPFMRWMDVAGERIDGKGIVTGCLFKTCKRNGQKVLQGSNWELVCWGIFKNRIRKSFRNGSIVWLIGYVIQNTINRPSQQFPISLCIHYSLGLIKTQKGS